MDLARLASQARDLLAFHLKIGISDYPATTGTAGFLESKAATIKRPAAVPPPSRKKSDRGEAAASGNPSAESVSRQLEGLVREYTDCNDCGAGSGTVISGQGTITPRLFVVGDCFSGHADTTEFFWSPKEDALFWKMMAAIGLDRESVFVTNCIKCGRKDALHADMESGRHCFSFLERELALLQPEVICTMGELATSLVLKSSTPLVRMRGRFHQYRYPHGSGARVMPTFHPRLLLEHPEMKQAAWKDLQAVQRIITRNRMEDR